MPIPEAMITAGAIAGDVTDDKAREIIAAALAAVDPERRTEIILEAVAPPDNGTAEEVLLEILRCANAWVPEARIIGNVRAGDVARAVSEILCEAAENRVALMGDATGRLEQYERALREVGNIAWNMARKPAGWNPEEQFDRINKIADAVVVIPK